VFVENRGGGGGLNATEAYLTSEPDGYTILVGAIGPFTIMPAAKHVSYDVEKDFIPLGTVWRSAQVLAVRRTLGVGTVAEFVAHAKAHPGTVTIGSAGVGAVTHLAIELLRREAGVDVIHVPFRSTGEVVNSMIGGNLSETGGGGGANCTPLKTNPAFSFGVFSDYEDSWIGGNVVIKNLNSCWMGFGRVYTGGSVTINNNEMADPDAIEIFSNYITKNLACSGNSHPASGMPPDDQPVWDSGETSMTGAIYPRNPQPNTVEGTRSGQCVKATPTTQGGSSSGALF